MKTKKIISIAILIFLSASIISVPRYVFADEPEQKEENSSDDTYFPPSDAWDGKYVEYKGKNGNVTRVYDSGSVETIYPDGTRDAVDYENNVWKKDKDGNENVKMKNGTSGLIRPDGTKEYYPDADHTIIFHTDDTSTSVNNKTGLCIDYDSNDVETAMYFEGGSEKLYYVDGGLPEGEYEIHGPNGEKLTYVDNKNEEGDMLKWTMSIEGKDGIHSYFEATNGEDGETVVTTSYPDGTKGEFRFKGDLDSDDQEDAYCHGTITLPEGEVYSFSENKTTQDDNFQHNKEEKYVFPDGKELKYLEESHGIFNTDGINYVYKESYIEDGKETSTSATMDNDSIVINYPDGAEMKGSFKNSSKAWNKMINGEISNEDYLKTFEDFELESFEDPSTGTRLWNDPNSKACELIVPEFNLVIRKDENGNFTQYDIDDEDVSMHLEDGLLTGYNKKTKTTIIEDINNNVVSIMTPDGTVYTEKDGKIWKNDQLVKENGEWLPGEESEFDSRINGTFSEEKEETFRPTADQIEGSWKVDLTLGNMSSMFLDVLIEALKQIFPEADVESAVYSEVDLNNRVVTVRTYLDVQKGAGNNDVKATMYIFDDEGEMSVYYYTGTIKKGKMKLKLQGQGDSDAGAFDSLTFDCYGQGDKIFMDGSFEMKSFMLNADVDYYGNLEKSGTTWDFE